MSREMEVLYADGSRSEFTEGGGSFHEGDLAILRIQLLTAQSALSLYIRSEGRMQITRNGATLAIQNVIEPLTGKRYKRSMNGKREALADCEALLAEIEGTAVVLEVDDD